MPVKNAIKYDVLFGIAYFNIPEIIINWITLSSELLFTL